ncbi:metal transporter [Novimethylophilus kurashikiensis]|uniref:Metal transporter n=1 Tax=Novimethylophilus kurashikiensis TaxID=1825523 RepID=A0A2R5F9V5_9PROT|nr:hypothetical protein [Novimethylophilus kurashikiensis]GBG14328.1 metal transporter [Novimethylophilus kurashikiensis]
MTTTNLNTTILTSDERRTLTAAWSAFHASGEARAEDFILYAILRGKNPKTGFTRITNPKKLANGLREFGGYQHALDMLGRAYKGPLTRKLALCFPGLRGERFNELLDAISAAIEAARKEA